MTTRKSVGFIFAAASHGKDIDPDIHVYTKRAMSRRRAYYVSSSNKKLIEENFKMYRRAKEPGILRTSEGVDVQLAQKTVA